MSADDEHLDVDDRGQVGGAHPPDRGPGETSSWGRLERRAALLEQVRRQAAEAEREDCASRVYAWAAGLTSEHDRLVAAAAAEVVLEGR